MLPLMSMPGFTGDLAANLSGGPSSAESGGSFGGSNYDAGDFNVGGSGGSDYIPLALAGGAILIALLLLKK